MLCTLFYSWLIFSTKVQRQAIAEHLKANTECHLKLACRKLQEFQALSTVNTANVTELQTEIVSAKRKIEDLSKAVLKSEDIQELRDKIAVTNERLRELRRKGDEKKVDGIQTIQPEVITLMKEVKELKKDVANDKRLMDLQDAVNELKKVVPKSNRLQDIRAGVTGTTKKLQKLEAAISKLDEGKSDPREIGELWDHIGRIERQLRDLLNDTSRDRSLLEQYCAQVSSYQESLHRFVNTVSWIVLIVVILVQFFSPSTVARKEELEVLEQKFLASSTRSEKPHLLQDESRCRKNKFIWSISDFDLRFRQAKTGSAKPCFFSEPFYSEPYGYRMSITMCPNGIRFTQNTHLSIFANLVRGINDASLPWPFQQKVVFTLIDQQKDPAERKDVQAKMSPKEMPHLHQSFAKAKKSHYRNEKGFGFPYFISHRELKTRNYKRNDTVLVQLEVYPLDCEQ